MAYPTSSPDRAVDRIDDLAIQVKSLAIRERDKMAAGNVPSTTIFDVGLNIRNARLRLAALAAIPGVKERAAAKKNTPELDVTVEFPVMLDAMDAVATWIANNFPKDPASGTFLLAQTLGPDGPVDRQFTPAQTAALRAQLDALIATID